MELDDRIAIVTPEGVTIEMVVAGIGSRFIAGMLDVAIEVGALVVVMLTFSALGLDHGWGLAVLVPVLFLILFGFHLLFEILNSGRTPGKAANGIRVVRTDGSPISVGASLVRNLLRLVDGWTVLTVFLCPVGFVTAFASRHTQRLGDHAAGTVVVRERFRTVRASRTPLADLPPPLPPAPSFAGPTWDLGGITADEVTLVRRYLDRRHALPAPARAHLAAELAARFAGRIPGADPRLTPDELLESIARGR